MEIIAYISIGFLVLRILVAISNILTRQWLPQSHPEYEGKSTVSVLIPARNEEENIEKLLKSLHSQDYKDIEIIVYDDDSSDGTAEILKEFGQGHQNFRWISGGKLPEGWTGKNHACHVLAGIADYEYLLFLDADIIIEKGLINDALCYMQKYDLALLSLFPVQKMRTLGEWLTVPLMNWILVSLLPMYLIRTTPNPSLAAANGQFMLFRKDVYLKNKFHERLRDTVVEDIAIIRLMKKMKYRVHTLLSRGQIKCRMYKGFREGIKGFSRNIFHFFGNSVLMAFMFFFLTTFGPIFIFLTLPIEVLYSYLAGVLAQRFLVSFMSRQSVLLNFLLIPFQQLSLLIILSYADFVKIRGRMKWKGREIH